MIVFKQRANRNKFYEDFVNKFVEKEKKFKFK